MSTAFFTSLRISAEKPYLQDFWSTQKEVRESVMVLHGPFAGKYGNREYHTGRIRDMLPIMFAEDMAPGERYIF